MIPLTDKIWKSLEGGYKIPFDASIPLQRLDKCFDSVEQQEILDGLFEELYHQGDVGLASYLSIPHLIGIGIKNKITDWRIVGLIATIEIARHSENNPKLPEEYLDSYTDCLKGITELTNLNTSWDRTYTCCALSAIAVSKHQIDIAEVILQLEDSELTDKVKEFLDNY